MFPHGWSKEDTHEKIQATLLPKLLGYAVKCSSAWAKILDGIDVGSVNSREALTALPTINKERVRQLQAEEPPFGGLQCLHLGGEDGISTIFVSPGPVFEPGRKINMKSVEGRGFGWRLNSALFGAGVDSSDLILNCFSYHRTPAGAMLEDAARQIGAAIIPAGTGDTSLQVQAARILKPTTYTGTPDFLKIILDKAEEEGEPLTCFRKALVSGGALYPSLREEYRRRGINCFQCYAVADVGMIAYEDRNVEEGMLVDPLSIVEIVRPGTGEPVPDGEVGEVLVTTLDYVYPMFRYATGDLSAYIPEPKGSDQPANRLRGWLGRADQSTKIKGLFVHASQVAEIASRCGASGRLRLEVSREGERDHLLVRCESEDTGEIIESRVREAVHEVTGLSCKVKFEAVDTLPNDGKVIDDLRDYSPGDNS